MRTKPRGSTWTRKRRRNSSTPSAMTFRASSIRVILPAEPDDAVDETDEAGVGDRDPVRIPPEVLERLRRPAKGPLRIHDPRCGPELREERGESARIGKRGRARGEGQLAVSEGASQPREILCAEDDRERLHWKQKRRAPADPAGAVSLQRDVIEEPQSAHHDVARAPRELSVAQQMHHIRLNLPVRDPIRRAAIKSREPRHRPQVRFARPVGNPPREHVVVHPSAQLRHDTPHGFERLSWRSSAGIL